MEQQERDEVARRASEIAKAIRDHHVNCDNGPGRVVGECECQTWARMGPVKECPFAGACLCPTCKPEQSWTDP